MATGRIGWAAALVGVLGGCGADNDGRGDGQGGMGVLSLDGGLATEGEGEDEGAGTMGGSGDGSSQGGQDDGSGDGQGPKFDLGAQPEPMGCNAGEVEGGGGAFSYIWIGNSPQGTVSKIDTETGVELGRYQTSTGSNSPSRTSVNQYGDVAVANRGDAGSLTKIAAETSHCVESNGIPGIQTSTGPSDVLAYGQDECVLWTTPLPSSGYDRGPRAVAWEGGEIDPETCTNTIPNPRVWVSWRGNGNDIEFRRLDGDTGAILDTAMTVGGGGRTYGGAVNAEGDFWVATRGGQDNLIHVDSVTLDVTVYNVPAGDNYGMTVDKDGDPWVVTYNEGTNYVYRLDVGSGTFVTAATSGARYRGIQIDREGRAWIAGNSPCRLSLVDAVSDSLIDDAIPLPGCGTPVGTSIDRDGFVWVVDQGTSTAYKVDPDSYDVVLQVGGLVQPYTYSDMTGSGLDLVINPPG
ncbi:Vgb family protein [Paraliomyxa miuraensis]|uniref:Vgb family protein n=1 Tax=Paraliomyxa miuraensis TaxID=376150 RepID=UPI00225083BF|nr:hypothetical protein [Paraliomyxa miuraensis]MCX4243397.1 hypothetical protein [Paraliomyxa miuraensis]